MTTPFDVTLTFDNGPEVGVTDAVLGVLEREHINATFFVLGRKLVDAEPRAAMARAHAAGHWIGNHTLNHAQPFGTLHDPRDAIAEIDITQQRIGALAHPNRLFRPSGGGGALGPHLLNPVALAHLVSGRYTCVLWNAVPEDWVDVDGWVDTALAQCAVQPWSVVVLHDLPTGAMRHLPRFIERVRAAGGRFRQDFPPACVPLERGVAVGPIDAYCQVTP